MRQLSLYSQDSKTFVLVTDDHLGCGSAAKVRIKHTLSTAHSTGIWDSLYLIQFLEKKTVKVLEYEASVIQDEFGLTGSLCLKKNDVKEFLCSANLVFFYISRYQSFCSCKDLIDQRARLIFDFVEMKALDMQYLLTGRSLSHIRVFLLARKLSADIIYVSEFWEHFLNLDLIRALYSPPIYPPKNQIDNFSIIDSFDCATMDLRYIFNICLRERVFFQTLCLLIHFFRRDRNIFIRYRHGAFYKALGFVIRLIAPIINKRYVGNDHRIRGAILMRDDSLGSRLSNPTRLYECLGRGLIVFLIGTQRVPNELKGFGNLICLTRWEFLKFVIKGSSLVWNSEDRKDSSERYAATYSVFHKNLKIFLMKR